MDTTEPPYENRNFRESETLEMPGEQSTFIKLKSKKCPEALSGRHGELQPVRRGFRCTRVEDVALCPWNIVTVGLLEFYQRLLQVFSDVGSRPAPTARRSKSSCSQEARVDRHLQLHPRAHGTEGAASGPRAEGR